jgi:predicted PurR-regulated permease PerM
MESTASTPRKIWIFFGIGSLFVALLLLLFYAANVLLVIFAGLLFGLLLNGLARLIVAALPISYHWALGLCWLLVLTICGLFCWFVGPDVVNQGQRLAEQLPQAVHRLGADLPFSERLQKLLATPQDFLPSVQTMIGGVLGIFSTMTGALAHIAVVWAVGIYLSIAPDLYRNAALRIAPPGWRQRLGEVADGVKRGLSFWLLGRMASMTVVGLLKWVGLLLLGVPLSLVLGLIAGLFSFIPNFGPILSTLPAVLIALMISPTKALYVILLDIAIQTVESYLITPLIQERAVSIPPALLISVQVLTWVLFGVVGLVLATPLTVAAIILFQMLVIEDVYGEKVQLMGEHGGKGKS